MGILTEEMKRVVTDIQLCYAATVTHQGSWRAGRLPWRTV